MDQRVRKKIKTHEQMLSAILPADGSSSITSSSSLPLSLPYPLSTIAIAVIATALLFCSFRRPRILMDSHDYPGKKKKNIITIRADWEGRTTTKDSTVNRYWDCKLTGQQSSLPGPYVRWATPAHRIEWGGYFTAKGFRPRPSFSSQRTTMITLTCQYYFWLTLCYFDFLNSQKSGET
ncbi:hypothetical protein V1477_013575 [Vespula maculifrons]|uniref:Uncharacterized protein n=1 Tax=Vespula maculifrons TaxID=7453 RepID=A0ABD2BPZ8_VESMC